MAQVGGLGRAGQPRGLTGGLLLESGAQTPLSPWGRGEVPRAAGEKGLQKHG